MSKCIRILQIGDIHLPDWPQTQTPIDDKDQQFSDQIKGDLVAQPLRSVLTRINDLASSNEIDAVVCVGDFTTQGKTEHIHTAVEILHHLLVDQYASQEPYKFAVPGNHDVSKTDALRNGAIEKFAALEMALDEFGWPPPPIEDCVRYEISTDGGFKIPIHLLNSSIGSWSTHLLPTPIEQELAEETLQNGPIGLDKDETTTNLSIGLTAHVDYSSREEQVYHQMDTPYFPVLALQSLKSFMDQANDDTILIVAHHNLLPQTIPRITHYSELLNSGQVRKFLQSSKKTIVYLHGHIHDDPVERVSGAQAHNQLDTESEIISISAPPVWEGFNEVGLFFDQDNEIFLIRITEYRPDDLGNVGNFSDQTSRYIPVKGRIEHLVTPKVQRVWAVVRDKHTLSWSEIVTESEKQNLNEDEVEHSLLSLFCCSLIRIGHLGRDRSRWRITANEAVT